MNKFSKVSLGVVVAALGLCCFSGGYALTSNNDKSDKQEQVVDTPTYEPAVLPSLSDSPTPEPVVITTKPAPKPTPKPTTKPTVHKTTPPPRPRTTTPKPPTEVYYANCAAVRAAGAAPLYRGQPGYSRKLDRDGDGVACEN